MTPLEQFLSVVGQVVTGIIASAFLVALTVVFFKVYLCGCKIIVQLFKCS